MTGATEDREMLAAEFVLGTLERHEARAVELMAESDRELAAAISAWQARLEPLARLVPEEPPPSELWTRLEEAIAPVVVKFPEAKPRALVRAWRSPGLWRGTTTGALAMAAAFAGLAFLRNPPAPVTKPMFIAELAPPPSPAPAAPAASPLAQSAAAGSAEHAGVQNFAQAAVGASGPKPEGLQSAAAPGPAASAAGSTLERAPASPPSGQAGGEQGGFVVASLADGAVTVKPVGPVHVPAGKELELWAQAPGAMHPQPLGVLPAGGMHLMMPELNQANVKLMVSLEPLGGALGAEPSGRVLYSGTLMPLQ